MLFFIHALLKRRGHGSVPIIIFENHNNNDTVTLKDSSNTRRRRYFEEQNARRLSVQEVGGVERIAATGLQYTPIILCARRACLKVVV